MTADPMTDRTSRFPLTAAERGKVAPRKFAHVVYLTSRFDEMLDWYRSVFVNGCVAGMFAMTPMVYESAHRVTGLGWGIGMGRCGSIRAPLAAGPLVDAQWRPDQIYTLYAAAFVLAAVTVVLLHLAVKGRTAA